MVKKIIALSVVFILALSVFTGCGNSTPPQNEPDFSTVVFADRTVVYDGREQSVVATGIPDGVTVKYENNKHVDAGVYEAKAEFYNGDALLKTLEATLTVNKKRATVVIDSKTSAVGDKAELTYTVDGVIDGDDLGVTLTVDTSAVGKKQIAGAYTNANYDVTFTGGVYTVTPDVSDAVFADSSVVYNGKVQSVTAISVPQGVTVRYKNNEHKDAGIYDVVAELYYETTLIKTLSAKLTVVKKQATVKVDDKSSMLGTTSELTYTVDGVIDGDDLGVTLSVKTATSGIKKISGTAANANYDVTFVGGTYTVYEEIMNNLTAGTTDLFVPSLAPFALKDAVFSETVITSVEFIYGGLVNGYTESSAGLYLPLYVVKKDFSTAQSECTVDNGKKILLDFTGKLDGVSVGDVVTADGLHIEVGADETLAFGDAQMAVLPKYKKNDASYGFSGVIFGDRVNNYYNNSLVFKIIGYSTKTVPNEDRTFISFLGDSISTYSGYSDSVVYNDTIGGNAVWFPNTNYVGADMSVDSTWWHRVYTQLDYSLCVNNSWSGSVVKTAQTYNVRAKNLHNKDGNVPDIVVIFMGVNDFAANTAVGAYDGTTAAPANPSDFSGAYVKTVESVKAAYPVAKVFCCTFLPDRKRTSTGLNGIGVSETAYNDAIRTIARNKDCYLIDFYTDTGITASNISSYTVDRLHPNSAGMAMIADTVVSAIRAAA